MNELPIMRPVSEILETFQERLDSSEIDFLVLLSNTFVNSVSWLSEVHSLLSDPGNIQKTQLACQQIYHLQRLYYELAMEVRGPLQKKCGRLN